MILDDEPLARRNLEIMLAAAPGVEAEVALRDGTRLAVSRRRLAAVKRTLQPTPAVGEPAAPAERARF